MSPAPPCTSTMGSITTFVCSKIKIICSVVNLVRQIYNSKSFVDIYTHVLNYSIFFFRIDFSKSILCVYDKPPLRYTVCYSCITAQTQKRENKKKNDLILSERHSDLRSKVKDLTSTNKSYAIIYFSIYSFVLFKLLNTFLSFVSRRSQQLRH